MRRRTATAASAAALVAAAALAGNASAQDTGQAGTDAGSDFGDCYRLFKRADGTIGQFDIRHGKYPGEKKVRE